MNAPSRPFPRLLSLSRPLCVSLSSIIRSESQRLCWNEKRSRTSPSSSGSPKQQRTKWGIQTFREGKNKPFKSSQKKTLKRLGLAVFALLRLLSASSGVYCGFGCVVASCALCGAFPFPLWPVLRFSSHLGGASAVVKLDAGSSLRAGVWPSCQYDC